MGTRYQGITRAVYGSEACCKTVGLTAFSNTDLNRTLYLVEFSEKIPGRFVENQHYWLRNKPTIIIMTNRVVTVYFRS